jgi:pyruvate dehydrogenase E2 component (dihydrolipoamide acetyltransferase)
LAQDVIMPALGMAQDVGLLIRWLKAEGEPVTAGEPLMEVETDKATVEIEAPASGILTGVTARAGDEIPVGQTIALIVAPGEAVPETAAPTPEAQEATGPAPARIPASPLAARLAAEHNLDLARIKPGGGRIQKADVLAHLAAQPASGRTPASPKARRLARERDLDLAAIPGSGPNGAVLAADVLAATAQPDLDTAEPAPDSMVVSRTWQVMVQRLTQSWSQAPHFYLVREANAAAFVRWYDSTRQRLAEKITYTDLLVKLTAVALRQHPRLNGRWEDDRIMLNSEVNIGLAVAVEDGLLVPVIHQADRLGLGALAAQRAELLAHAQAGSLSLADLQGGTFTLSNLGMYGVDAFNAIINPPQAAILAVGRIADRVVALNGQPAVQPMLTLTLSCDHRVVDGARGATFLQTLVDFIEDPIRVLE